MGDLTKNFSVSEFEQSQVASRHMIDNTILAAENPDWVYLCLSRTAYALQMLRDKVEVARREARSVSILSGYRCIPLNRKIGSFNNSQHVMGEAADIRVQGMSAKEVFEFIYDDQDLRELFDQVILEFGSWVHISVCALPRKQYLIATRERRVIGPPKTVYTPYLNDF